MKKSIIYLWLLLPITIFAQFETPRNVVRYTTKNIAGGENNFTIFDKSRLVTAQIFALLKSSINNEDIIALGKTLPVVTNDCSSLDQDIFMDEQCNVTIPDLTGLVTVFDNLGVGVSITQSPAANEVIPSAHFLKHVIIFKAIDIAGVELTCSATLTAKDITAPRFTEICSTADQEIPLNSGCELVVPDLSRALAVTDNCDNAIVVTQMPIAGSIIMTEHDSTHAITLTAIDNANLTAECVVTLTAKDVTAPIFLTDCTTLNQEVNLNNDCKIRIPDFRDLIEVDENCDKNIIISQAPAANALIVAEDNDTPEVIITAIDPAGNASRCAIILTVKDKIAPVITTDCTNFNQELNLDENGEITIPNFLDLVQGSDQCTAVHFLQEPAALSSVPLAHNETLDVVITATDLNGNRSSCTTILTAKDLTAPTILTDCRSLDWSVFLTGTCKIVVPNLAGMVEVMDNDEGVVVTQSPILGSMLDSGHGMTHPITITAKDNTGLETTCTVILTGKDITKPTIHTDCSQLNQDVILNNDCDIIVPNLAKQLFVTDNCDNEIEITQIPEAGTPIALTDGDSETVTLTATDNAGLTTTCTATLTARDGTTNILNENCGAAITTVNLNENCDFVYPDLISNLPSSISCGQSISYVQMPIAGTSENSFHDNTHPVTIIANFTDNTSEECIITLTAKDATGPVFTDACNTLAEDVNLDFDCMITVPDLTETRVTDNCSAVTLTQRPEAGTKLASSHNESHTIILTATDEANQTSICNVKLTAKDIIPPSITTDCVALSQEVAIDGNCQITVPDFKGIIMTADHCSNDNIDFIQRPAAGAKLNSSHDKTHNILIIVLDGAENSKTCAVTLTGKDVSAPSIVSHCSHLSQDVDLQEDCQFVFPDLTNSVEFEDNCDGIVEVTQLPAPNTIINANHGDTHTVTFTITDARDNSTTCSTILTAKDNTYPSPVPRNITVALGGDSVSITGEQLNGNSTDNCEIVAYSAEPNTFTEEGEYDVTFGVTDVGGNNVVTTVIVNVITAGREESLPIELLSFTAKENAGQSWLQWTMPRTNTVASFNVEWSTNAQQWSTIGSVTTTVNKQQYEFTHTKPVKGANYYRLQQVEVDGALDYSSILDLTIEQTLDAEVAFYPNPTTHQVEVVLPNDFEVNQPVEVSIYNLTGQLVQRTTLSNTLRLDLKHISEGLYHIHLMQNDLQAKGRVLKID